MRTKCLDCLLAALFCCSAFAATELPDTELPKTVGSKKIAALPKKEKVANLPETIECPVSPLHYRPKTGVAGDTIPFYWQGSYHIFYLHQRDWAHIVSTDLIHWKELPDALSPGKDPKGPDGQNCWTGSIVEHDGLFHLFYTGQNMQDPAGDQKVMVATSKDLIQWEKQPDRTFYADGRIYWSKPINGPANDRIYHHQAFRDPDVFWHEGERQWWMLLHALTVDGLKPCIGLYCSKDLVRWKPRQPLATYPPMGVSLDCPHMASVQGRSFIIAADTHYISADNPNGPYSPEMVRYDSGDLFVPKSLFDGKRRLIWGWIRDLEGHRDAGKGVWGGTLSMAREIYAGPSGQLYTRPAVEINDAFTKTVLSLCSKPAPRIENGSWQYSEDQLICDKNGGICAFDVPDNYMLQCSIRLDPEAALTITMRQQKQGDGYDLVLRPKSQEAGIRRGNVNAIQKIKLDVTKPIKIQAFVQGTIIECFINDQYSFTCRAYDYPKGHLRLRVEGENACISDLTVKTLSVEIP